MPSWNTLLSLFFTTAHLSMLAAVCPTDSLSIPETTTSTLLFTFTSTPGKMSALLGTLSPK